MEPPPILCEELLEEILSLLPVKSLVRFRCVSQSWKSIISDSQFIKFHLHRSSSTTRNIDFAHLRSLVTSPSESRSAVAKIPIRTPGYSFCGTCNGLICFSTDLVYDTEHDEYTYLFRLWNPATRSMSQHSPPLHFTTFAPWYFGFGYDSSTDTYKVVAAQASFLSWVNVYNMGDTCWRRNQVPVPHLPGRHPRGDAVSVSNTLNWLAILPADAIIKKKTDLFTIISFDLGNENCSQLSLPDCSPHGFYHFVPVLGVLRGCLCISLNDGKRHFGIWQMKEFGVHESWTMLFNITTAYESILNDMIRWDYFEMYMCENGDDALLLSKSGALNSQAVLYTKENNVQMTNMADGIVDCYAMNYIESLVSPY